MTDYTYAVLDANNVVDNIVAADNDSAAVVLEMMIESATRVILVTEETGPAYIGGDFRNGLFRSPRPFTSWVWDEDNASWVAPVPYPEGGSGFTWDEASVSWSPIPVIELIEDPNQQIPSIIGYRPPADEEPATEPLVG